MNLFKELVLSAPVSNRLQFGYNENIIVSAIDTSVRKVKGLPIKANTFITLSQVDPTTRKVVAQNEFNYFNLDSTSDFVVANFIEQFTSLAALLEAMGKNPEDYDRDVIAALGITAEELDDFVKTKDGAKTAQDAMQNIFAEMASDVIGDNCPLMRCKLVVNKKGYLEICKVQGWILPMTSTEELPAVTANEKRIRAEALTASDAPKTVKPDTLGDSKPAAPAAEKPTKSVGFAGL